MAETAPCRWANQFEKWPSFAATKNLQTVFVCIFFVLIKFGPVKFCTSGDDETCLSSRTGPNVEFWVFLKLLNYVCSNILFMLGHCWSWCAFASTISPIKDIEHSLRVHQGFGLPKELHWRLSKRDVRGIFPQYAGTCVSRKIDLN